LVTKFDSYDHFLRSFWRAFSGPLPQVPAGELPRDGLTSCLIILDLGRPILCRRLHYVNWLSTHCGTFLIWVSGPHTRLTIGTTLAHRFMPTFSLVHSTLQKHAMGDFCSSSAGPIGRFYWPPFQNIPLPNSPPHNPTTCVLWESEDLFSLPIGTFFALFHLFICSRARRTFLSTFMYPMLSTS